MMRDWHQPGETADRLAFHIQPQPDDSTCGPTCLPAVYHYFDDEAHLDDVIAEVPALRAGGTLAVLLACHALRRGYKATIYTYNVQVFDPTWFNRGEVDVAEKLIGQREAKPDEMLRAATDGYLEFLRLGGKLRFEDLTTSLIRRYLKDGVPILTGLSATYLYHSPREFGPTNVEDDVRGLPVGHFVVLCGYQKDTRQVLIADPLHPNPVSDTHIYSVSIDRVVGAILLGVITHDANLLLIRPKRNRAERTP